MLFNLSLKNVDSSIDLLLVSGSSWSNCLSYAEGTGKDIQSILISNADNIILNNTSLSGYYLVLLKNTTTSQITNNLIYDTFENASTWAQSQTGNEVSNVQFQKKSFIAI